MEPIGHVEWTLGIVLIVFGFLNLPLNGFEIFLVCFGAILPDIIDALTLWGSKFHQKHRAYTHNVFFLVLMLILSLVAHPITIFIPFNPVAPLFVGSLLHVFEDILSGIGPVFPFRPISDRFPLLIFTRDGSETVGRLTKKILGNAYIGVESLEADELAWFWFLTLLGSWVLIAGLLAFFL